MYLADSEHSESKSKTTTTKKQKRLKANIRMVKGARYLDPENYFFLHGRKLSKQVMEGFSKRRKRVEK